MDLLTLAKLVVEHDEAGFIDNYSHHVLLDIESLTMTRQGVPTNLGEDFVIFPYGLLELEAKPGQRLMLGRNKADLVVNERNVSAQHVSLEKRSGGTWIVKDQGSTNGTTINGTRLLPNFPMPLTPGSVLGLGPGIRLTLLDARRLYRALEPVAEDYVAMTERSEAIARGEISDEQTFFLHCAPFPPLTLEEGKPVTVGRDAENALALPHPDVSRQHLTLERKGKEVAVTDLKSANGTYVGPLRVKGQARARDGAVIEVGPYVLRIEAVEPGTKPRAPTGAEETHRLDLTELRGSLQTMPLRELLHSVEHHDRSGAIRVEGSEGQSGEVEFVDGRPTWATFGRLRGVDAILHMLDFEGGAFRFDPRGPQDMEALPAVRDGPRIDVNFRRILLEANRRRRERTARGLQRSR